MKYQVLEDNAGGMYLFFFDESNNVVLGIENIEYLEPGDLGDLNNVTLKEVQSWDGQLIDPQMHYDGILSYSFGYELVADNEGVYPDCMGQNAKIVYQIVGD